MKISHLLHRLFFVFSALAINACQSKQEAPTEQPPMALVPVIVEKPKSLDISICLDAMGILSSSSDVEIRPKVSGVLEKVNVYEGQWVNQGASLFKIEEKPYALKFQQAKAQLEIDRADLEFIEKKLARYNQLAQKDFVSQTEWDDLNAAHAKAKANVHRSEASTHQALLDLQDCTIIAPIEGRVGKIDAQLGSFLTAQQAVLTEIAKLDPLSVEFYLTEKDFLQIPDEAGTFELSPLSEKGKAYPGTITFWDNHFDPKTGLIFVRGLVDNKEQELHPGQSVKLSIPVAVLLDAIVIPQKAVRFNQKGAYVFTLGDDRRVKLCSITLGDEHGSDIIVTEGLDTADSIIIEGHLRVHEGAEVEIRQAQALPASSSV